MYKHKQTNGVTQEAKILCSKYYIEHTYMHTYLGTHTNTYTQSYIITYAAHAHKTNCERKVK